MKASSLKSYLNNEISAEDFYADIKNETTKYEALIKKRGTSISIYFAEDTTTIINKEAIKKLLEDVLLNNINSMTLSYICDCLTLGEKVEFSDAETEDIIFSIADPEINGSYKTAEEIRSIIEFLD